MKRRGKEVKCVAGIGLMGKASAKEWPWGKEATIGKIARV